MKNVCNICGGNYIYKNGIWVCESCGAPAISEIGSEEDGWLHSAELALQKSDFDDAINDYNAVIEKFPNNPYAYWGRMLANYAIKYEIDPITKKATPSFYDISYSSILSNSDYLKAVELSKDELHKHFINEGNFLEELRIKLISKVENEDSFDIFISYKDKSDDVLGTITEDREKCKKIFDYLTSLGYKVFFAPISLKNHLGINFEPFIFKAIYTCQVMLVVGSKPEYFMSNWVKNEWSRYLRHIGLKEKNKNSLLPIISGFKETYLPKQLSKIECLDFDSSTFFESLKDYVSSIVSLDSYSFKKIQRRKRINIVNEQVSNDNKGIKLLKITPLKNNEVEKEIKKNIERKKLGQFLVKGIINKDIENKQIELDIYLANEQYEKVVSSCNEFLENNDNLWLILKYKLLGELKCKNVAEIKSLNDFNDFELINNLLESCPLTEANKILNGLSTSIFSFYVNGNFEFAFKLFNCVISYQSKIIDTLALNILSRRTIENKDKYWLKIQLLLLNNFDIDSDRDYLQFLITNLLEVRDYANFSIFADLYLKKFGLDSFSLVYKWIKENNSINETEAIIQMFGGNIETLVGKFKEISKNDVSLLLSKVEKILIDLINNKRYDACYKISLNYLKLKQNQAYINSFLNVCLNNCGDGIEQVVDLFLSVKKYASSDLKEKLLLNFAQKFNGICSFNVSTKYCKQVLSINIKNIDAYKLIIKNDIGICYDADFIKKLQLFSDYKIFEQFFSVFDNESDLIKELNNLIELALKNLSFKNDKKIYSFIDFVLQYYPETGNNDYVNSLFLIGNASKDLGFYENAKNYYLNILDIDNKNADAYWCLLLCNLKVKNDDELVYCDIPIATLTEFKNAVASAGIDRTKIERYISLSTKQEDCIKKKQIKKEKFKRGVIFSSVSLFVVVLTIVLSLLSVYVIIPNNNFNQVVSLLNNEKIDEAGDYLSINNVNRADELEKFVEAGTYFKNSDYINGIEKFLDAGGEVTINYDANGGSFDITTETIKPTKLKKQEFAEKTGYLFDKWEMTTFDFDLSNFDNCTAVVNLKASYTIINYEIKYELNGGKLDNAFNTYNVTCDDIHIGIPTKDGYTFKGWSTQYDSNPIEDFVIKSGTIGDIKLIANWEANEYTINYDYGYDNKTSSQNVIYDESYTLEEPQREGYIFDGRENNNEEFTDGVWNITSDVNLRATWSLITYNISYDANGGSNNPSNLTTYNVETPTFELLEPSRTGYNFLGWSGTNLNEITKTVVIETGTIGNLSFKAEWEPITYIIHLDANGGECEKTSMSIAYDSDFILPTPTRDGYTFVGWFNKENDEQISNGVFNFTQNLNLCAKWNINGYNIIYELNGGLNNSDNVNTFNFESEDITIKDPTRKGYTFTGWNSIFGNNQFSPIIPKGSYGDITFEATWTPNEYTIIFDGSGATSGSIEPIKGYVDQSINLPNISFVKTGYHQIGWQYLTEKLDFGSGFVLNGESWSPTITIGALWEANENTINFNGNGATSGEMESQIIKTDESEPLNANQFEKEGYHFVGWSTSENGDADYSNNALYIMGPNSSYDLYAVWEPNTYNIAYDLNGGNLDKNIAEVKYNETFTLDIPTRDGYEFAGWYIGDIQLTDAYGSSLSEYSYLADLTAIAHWTANINKIILINNGNITELEGATDSWINLPKNELTVDGLLFDGWSKTEGGSVEVYDGGKLKVPAESTTTLYGIWNDYSDYKIIETKQDLNTLAGQYKVSGKYCLNADIDFNGDSWNPIVNFDGEFLGRGHSISNVVFEINDDGPNDWDGHNSQYNGLTIDWYYFSAFIEINNGKIDALNLVNYNFSLDQIDHQLFCSKVSMVNYHYCLAGLTGRNKGNISNCNVNFNAEINFYKNVSYHIGILSVINEGNIANCAVKCNAIFTGNLKSAEYEGVNYGHSVHPYFTFGTITTYYYMFIGSFGEYQIGSASNCFISCNLINEVDLGPYSSASVFGVGENDDQNYSQIYYEGNIDPLETENDNIIFV